MDDESLGSIDVEETEVIPDMFLPLKKSILKAFKLMDKELKLHPTIDCFCSGTTAVALIKQVLVLSTFSNFLLMFFFFFNIETKFSLFRISVYFE